MRRDPRLLQARLLPKKIILPLPPHEFFSTICLKEEQIPAWLAMKGFSNSEVAAGGQGPPKGSPELSSRWDPLRREGVPPLAPAPAASSGNEENRVNHPGKTLGNLEIQGAVKGPNLWSRDNTTLTLNRRYL